MLGAGAEGGDGVEHKRIVSNLSHERLPASVVTPWAEEERSRLANEGRVSKSESVRCFHLGLEVLPMRTPQRNRNEIGEMIVNKTR